MKTLRMTGRANGGPGREAIVRREIARPGRIRTEFVFQGTTGIYAFDGKQGWRVSPLDGSLDAETLPDEEAAGSAEQADIEGPLVDWKAKGHKVEVLTVPGVTLTQLKDADGTALVIHAKADDNKTDPSGNSGDRIACAVL